MPLIPPGNYLLIKLIENIVAQKYGKDAIAKCTIRASKKGEPFELFVTRAGKEIPKEEDDKRWEEASEAVHEAILDERLKAYVSAEDGLEEHITIDEWERDQDNVKFEDHQEWDTLWTGNLSWKAKPAFDGQPVYFQDNEANEFLNTLGVQSEPKEEKDDLTKALKNEFSKIGQKGGKQPKLLKGVLKAVEQILIYNEKLTAQQVWVKLSQNDSYNSLIIDDYEIYVDGETIIQINTKTKNEKSIKETTFRRYVSRAKPHPSS